MITSNYGLNIVDKKVLLAICQAYKSRRTVNAL